MQRGGEPWRGTREVESHGDTEWHRKVQDAEQAIPQPQVVNKNSKGHVKCEGSQPQTRPPNPGFQHQEDKSPLLLAIKTSGVWGGRRTGGISRRLLKKSKQWL